jgi:hypothetical protein
MFCPIMCRTFYSFDYTNHMKLFIAFLFILLLLSCGSNSSPEGRMTNKMEAIRNEFDSLKKQNAMILDSLGKISEHLQKLDERK